VVEDDPSIGANLERALDVAGYSTTWETTVAGARSVPTRPDLVLLDLGLPDGDGRDVADDLLRRWPGLPIMMLTARTDEIDVVMGLDSGAVDYVTKPFRLAELLARIRTHLRTDDGRSTGPLIDGALLVDTAARRVVLDGSEIVLRSKEFDLLVALMSRRGTVVTREQLMAEVWDENWFGPTKTLDVHIAALRRRLGESVGEPSRITTLRGIGYRWDPAVDPGEDR